MIVTFTLRIKPKVFEMPVLYKQNAPIIKDLEIRQLQNNSCNVAIAWERGGGVVKFFFENVSLICILK